MKSEPASLPLSALLEHEAFVRSLARRLLDDAHAAEDLAQDTWTELIVHPPRAVRSVRAWLAQSTKNRASNARRAAGRRALHEERTARPDAGVEHDALERVELESRVVLAVLALREPYRSVVLGRYYEGRSTKELAARQGVTENTVRSQEARALELLRVELDRAFDGGRDAWGLALAGWISESSSASTTVVEWSVGLASAASLATLVWFGWKALDVSAALPAGPLVGEAAEVTAEDASAPSVVSSLEPEHGRQAATATASTSAARPDFATAPLDELLVLGQQIQRELREKLLTPEPEVVQRHPRDIAPAVGGYARLLDRSIFGLFGPRVNALGIREGGSFFSFVTKSSSFDERPTIHLSQGSLSTASRGTILPARGVRIDRVPDSADQFPEVADLDAEFVERWRALWMDWPVQSDPRQREHEQRLRELGLHSSWTPTVGTTFLVRTVGEGDFDLLAALEVLADDDFGITFAWRILKSWPISPRPGGRSMPSPLTTPPPSPRWLAELGAVELLELQDQLWKVSEPRLFAPAPDLVEHWADLLREPDTGIVRLFDDERWSPLLSVAGGGTCASFEKDTRAMTYGANVALSKGRYRSAFWGGDLALLLHLGDVDPRNIREFVPEPHEAGARERWDLLWNLRAPIAGPREEREVPEQIRERLRALELEGSRTALSGHTYLLRSAPSDPTRPDLLACFRDVASDEHGRTLVWRILQRFPNEHAEKR